MSSMFEVAEDGRYEYAEWCDRNPVAAAYETGKADTYPAYHVYEMADASRAWKKAQFDHAHTSFYGVTKIREMRAYWLGRLRAERDRRRP